MDGTPHLLTDVKFSERRRGYDPEEVDNFLERVSSAVAQLQDKLREATARAEEADARIADAQRGKVAAEAELARAQSESSTAPPATATVASDPEADADKASRILLMAQKTADATIDDANETAQQTIAEARTTAAGLVADAEAEADRTRTDARTEADALVQERRDSVEREVRELEDLKVAAQSDIDILGAHLDEQRARIRRGVEALALVLDDPDGLRVGTPPVLHDTNIDAVVVERTVIVEETVLVDDGGDELADDTSADDTTPDDTSADDTTADDTTVAPQASAGDEPAADDVVVLTEGIDVSGVDLTAAPEPARAPGGIFGATSQTAFDAKAEAPQLKAVPDESGDIDLAEDELFAHVDRADRTGPPTQQFTPFGESEDPLGPPDDEADKAMRAFFETDFDTSDPDEQKSRFGFRR